MRRRGRPRAVGLPALVLVLGAAACGPERPERSGDPALDAHVRVSPTPAVVGVSRISVQAVDGSTPLAGARVRLRAEAVDTASSGPPPDPVAGAAAPGSWTDAPPTAGAPGAYGPVALAFPAPGAWRLVVEVTAPDGRTATLRRPLAVVGAPGG